MQMTLDEINSKRRHGDLVEAGQIVGLTRRNARNALMRPTSKHHDQVKAVVTAIIENRENLAARVRG